MKFRDDIDPARTWVTSDSHFGHENIKAFCHRPDDVEQIMMENWAREVPSEATVVHLGDLAWKNNAWFRSIISPHLTGERKLLLLGNHDRQRFSFYKKCGFQPVPPFAIKWGKWTVSFSHYPWNEKDEGDMPEHHLRLHGHIHNNGYARATFVPFLKNHVNLSVEQTKYKPVNLALLLGAVINGNYSGGESVEELTAELVSKLAH